MASPVFGEFVGTTVLVLMGDGVVGGVLLKGSKAANAGWMVITAGWAFAVFIGVVTAVACGSPGADLNPAVTLAAAIHSGNYSHVMPFALAQTLGATFGATLVWLFYHPHWRVTEDASAKLAVFCTAPAIRSRFWNFFCEALATAVLLLAIAAIGSKTFAAAGPAPGLAPYLVAIVVWGIGLSLGGTTGNLAGVIVLALDVDENEADAARSVVGADGRDLKGRIRVGGHGLRRRIRMDSIHLVLSEQRGSAGENYSAEKASHAGFLSTILRDAKREVPAQAPCFESIVAKMRAQRKISSSAVESSVFSSRYLTMIGV
jgi:glycerol uptake facilitator protein